MNLIKTKSYKNKFLFVFILALAGFFCWQKNSQAAGVGDVVISEIMVGQEGATKNEFVELYNRTDVDIDLSRFSLKKKTQSGNESVLVSAPKFIGIISSRGYFLIASPDYQAIINADLPYSGASTGYAIAADNTVLLYDNSNNLLDKVGYGEATDAETQSAPALANNSTSIARRVSAGVMQDTDNNANDFETQTCPSPKVQSATCHVESGNEQNNESDNFSDTSNNILPTNTVATSTNQTSINYRFGDVVINEFAPDPADGEVEFIELYNKQSGGINLDGWFLYDGSGAKTTLSGTMEKYFVIEKPAGNLNNAGDLIILKQGETIIDQVAYGNWKDGDIDDNAPTASDPKSIARAGDGFNTYNNKNDFAVTATLTKGAANIIAGVSSSDAETQNFAFLPQNNNSDIIISEILPQPRGDEVEGEFIELFNRSDREVNLENWILSDGSTRKYAIKKIDATNNGIDSNDNIIKPQGYFMIYRKESKIALNNSGDEVKLFQPNVETPAQIVKYEKSVEGQSYNLKNATSTPLIWEWSEVITPGAVNIIKIKHAPAVNFDWSGESTVGQIVFFNSSDTEDADGDNLTYLWNFGTGATSTEANPIYIYLTGGNFQVSLSASDGEHTIKEEKIIKIKAAPDVSSAGKTAAVKGVKIASATPSPSTPSPRNTAGRGAEAKVSSSVAATTLESIREFNVGSFVKVEGIVAVKPGIFSTQYFYIVGSSRPTSNEVSGQAGVQVYSNKKSFPALEIGDKISVAGQLSESYGELRLKTKAAADIKKIATSTLPAPVEILADEIGEELEAQLVRVSGLVVDKKGSSIWLDDGNGEAEVYFKQGAKISKENINEGDTISVIGIVSQSNEKYRILPRSSSDIILADNQTQQGQVLGETSTSDSWQLAQNNKKIKLIQYLLILSGGLIVVLAGVIWKGKK